MGFEAIIGRLEELEFHAPSDSPQQESRLRHISSRLQSSADDGGVDLSSDVSAQLAKLQATVAAQQAAINEQQSLLQSQQAEFAQVQALVAEARTLRDEAEATSQQDQMNR